MEIKHIYEIVNKYYSKYVVTMIADQSGINVFCRLANLNDRINPDELITMVDVLDRYNVKFIGIELIDGRINLIFKPLDDDNQECD